MCLEVIRSALDRGAKIFASVSGGKDSEAMVRTLSEWRIPVEGLVNADLGRVEWKQSLEVCYRQSCTTSIPLFIVRRKDGADLIDRWKHRLEKLRGTGKPFWSSAKNRYCTSDLKIAPINQFFTTAGPFIISAEGIRSAESSSRNKKQPLSIRWAKTSTFYKGMSVEQAIASYRPDKRLSLTWYPIFNYSVDDVWKTGRMNIALLEFARVFYNISQKVVPWWTFHPAYVFGNDRVSCMICFLASYKDKLNGARHNSALLEIMIALEKEGKATFMPNFSLTTFLKNRA